MAKEKTVRKEVKKAPKDKSKEKKEESSYKKEQKRGQNSLYMPIKVIAFDADDTLWANEGYFQETEKKFFELFVRKFFILIQNMKITDFLAKKLSLKKNLDLNKW